jgi:hypothetical protein
MDRHIQWGEEAEVSELFEEEAKAVTKSMEGLKRE